MIQKQSFNVIKGMRQDISPSKASPEYIFDARNIRLTARGNDTLLSISNEQGTQECRAEDGSYLINGIVLGYCVLNNFLVTFSRNFQQNDRITERITRVYQLNNKWHSDILYSSHRRDKETNKLIETSGNLNFGDNIQTLGIYENENIQKVYWVDGVNQPRVINIVKDWLEGKTVEEVANNYINTSFDFVPELKLEEEVSVSPVMGINGSFSSGTIQYAFTYYNKYGQESNIFYTTDLYYITHPDRGGSPEDKINVGFNITVNNIDTNFDFIRVYSIHRTSLDATPEVRKVIDFPIEKEKKNLTSYSTFKNQNDVWVRATVNKGTAQEESFDQVYWKYDDLESGIFPTTTRRQEGAKASSEDYVVFDSNKYKDVVIYNMNQEITFQDSDQHRIIFISTDPVYLDNGLFSLAIVADENSQLKLLNIDTAQSITFTDTGNLGDSVDPTFLLYVGGEDIVANTLSQKDNTLFLGNLSINKPSIPINIKQLIYDNDSKKIKEGVRTDIKFSPSGTYYNYSNSNIGDNPCTFKFGEHYRLGVQFQYKNGKWSEPILVKYQYIINKYRPSIKYPSIDDANSHYNLPYIEYSMDLSVINAVEELGFKKVRGIIVNPSLQDRRIILQGIVCPTVYEGKVAHLPNITAGTRDGFIYSQSSWFLRLNTGEAVEDNGYLSDYYNDDKESNIPLGAIPEFRDKEPIKATLRSGQSGSRKVYRGREVELSTFNTGNTFYIDKQIVTLHSPDIQFDDSINILDTQEFNFDIVGISPFHINVGDINITTSSPTITSILGKGFKNYNIRSASDGARSLVAGFFYEDGIVTSEFKPLEGNFAGRVNTEVLRRYLIYPWQTQGSLNNDVNRPADKGTRSSVLKRKVISNIKFSKDNIWNPTYNGTTGKISWGKVKIHIFNSNEVSLIKLDSEDKTYYGNVDTLLTPYSTTDETVKVVSPVINGENPIANPFLSTPELLTNSSNMPVLNDSVRIKYKSTPHIVVNLSQKLPNTGAEGGQDIMTFNGYTFNENLPSHLFLVELSRDDSQLVNPFGGESELAVQNNLWIPSGKAVNFKTINADNTLSVKYLHGDCYYQRYDCLKTYPFTQEDENSIVEIGSFMVETRVNIDGRYDRNRGQLSNLNMTPQNFNLLNPIYSQKDNFFNYRILDEDYYKLNNFRNSITWSKEKSSGEVQDTWTNITMTNTFDVDGNLGQIQSIENYNNELYCFQDKGISRILFNNRVQIPTGDNVPIEISNGYKVQGKVYISNTVGCQNQKAIKVTPNGIYFSDLNNSGIYLLNQQGMQDISTPRGFTNWVKECQPTQINYDTNNGDIYLIGRGYPYDSNPSKDLSYKNCLCFSEKLNEFTSFMDYNYVTAMFNIDNSFYSLYPKQIGGGNLSSLYKMFSGNYNDFFDVTKPYNLTYISNQNPTNDKIFNTLEFRGDSLNINDKLIKDTNVKMPNICPFNKVTVWNEYQEGEASLNRVWGKPSNLKEKFRTWRVNIPRDKSNNRDRIRNPWAYIKLEGSNNTNRMQLHDLQVYYYDNSLYGYGNQRRQ